MPRSNNSRSLLGLFPNFGDGCVGGIQASAEIAWAAVEKHSQAELLVYSNDGNRLKGQPRANGSRAQALLAALRKDKPHDVVLVWQIGLLKLVPFLRHRKKVVLYLHGIEAWKTHDWLTSRITRSVDLFLTNSDYTWNRFIEHNPKLKNAPHLKVALGIDESLTDQTNSPTSEPIALMIARLALDENYKGHRQVIEAWSDVMAERPGARLIIVGSGDLSSELQNIIDTRGLSNHVTLVGEVDKSTKENLLKDARCLLMPSRNEGFGLVYLEAMRLGRPCLVSTIDAGREVVNPPEAGLAVDPDNRKDLATAICKLLDDGSHWEVLSKAARDRYEQHYTAKHFQERLIAALDLASANHV